MTDRDDERMARGLSPEREAAARRASEIVRAAARQVGGACGVARALGISESRVRAFADPSDASTITLRDLLAGRHDFARACCALVVADLDAASPAPRMSAERHAMRLAHVVGRLVGALDDLAGATDLADEDRRRVLAALAAVDEQAAALRRDLMRGPGLARTGSVAPRGVPARTSPARVAPTSIPRCAAGGARGLGGAS